MSGPAPAVGLIGDLHDEAVSAQLAVRVAKAELGRRLPGATIVALAMPSRGGPLDGGEPPGELGAWTAARRAELAERLHVVGLLSPAGSGGGRHRDRSPHARAGSAEQAGVPAPEAAGRFLVEGLGAEHQDRCPSLPLDQTALAALSATCLPDEALDRRLAWLAMMGWYRPGRSSLVLDVEGTPDPDPTLVAVLARTARAHPDLVVTALGPGARQWHGPMTDALGARVTVLDYSLSLEDVAAVCRAASVVVGSAPAAEGLALAYGRPFLAIPRSWPPSVEQPGGHPGGTGDHLDAELEPAIEAALGSSPETGGPASPALSRQQRLAEAQLDALVATALASASARGRGGLGGAGGGRLGAGAKTPAAGPGDGRDWAAIARRAGAAQGASRRLARAEWVHRAAVYRSELEERLAALRRETSDAYARYDAELDGLRCELDRLRAESADLGAQCGALREALTEVDLGRDRLARELEATHATLLFRWASRPRRIYGWLLGRRHRGTSR